MKAIILAGGLGTRLSEETEVKPKPMVEIGGYPILWHIMKIYSHYGVNDFIVCLGYKGDIIKNYFMNYSIYRSNVTFDMLKNSMEVHHSEVEPWRITLINTGDSTDTGGRLKRAIPYVGDDDVFCFTYGDGVADVDISAVIDQHKREGRLATVTAAQQPGRFGALRYEGSTVTGFQEKPVGDGGWINAGFFVLSPKVADYIAGDHTAWEREPLEKLSGENQLGAHFHRGFWQAMDTLRDKRILEQHWSSGQAPWRVW